VRDTSDPLSDIAEGIRKFSSERRAEMPRAQTPADRDEIDIAAAAEWHSSMSLRASRTIGDEVMARWKKDKPPSGIELAELLSDWAFGVVHPTSNEEEPPADPDHSPEKKENGQ
jgi:hypothetical protein